MKNKSGRSRMGWENVIRKDLKEIGTSGQSLIMDDWTDWAKSGSVFERAPHYHQNKKKDFEI